VVEIIAGYGNSGGLETDGVDLRINTDFDFGNWGALQNRMTVSWVNSYEVTDNGGNAIDFIGYLGLPEYRATLGNDWTIGDWTMTWNVNYIDGQRNPGAVQGVGGYATNDVQLSWNAPWNGRIAVGATNVGDRYPELVAYDGRPWNFYLYDAYGRTVYMRYTQTF